MPPAGRREFAPRSLLTSPRLPHLYQTMATRSLVELPQSTQQATWASPWKAVQSVRLHDPPYLYQ